jgi:flagellin-like hook-associated protein FlgL
MSLIPPFMSRVPNLLQSQLAIGTLSRTNLQLLRVQEQLATGRAVNRVSDDSVKAATITVLNDRLDRSEQYKRNMSHAAAALGVLDSTLGEASDLALQAKSIASEQMNVSSSASERAGQANVIDQIIQSFYNLSNTSSVAGYLFGGSQGTRAPVEALGSGYRYVGSGSGVRTDLGTLDGIPISLGSSPIAGVAARVRGAVDLNPSLTLNTRLSELDGARALGVTPGPIEFTFNGGAPVQVDLTGTDTIRDVAAKITAAIRQYETDNSVTVLGPGGVNVAGGAMTIDVAAGGQLRFADIGSGTSAADLGLANPTTPFDFTSTTPAGLDVNPRLTWTSPVSSLTGLTGPLDTIRISNAGKTANIDLSGATSLQDVRNKIEQAGLGVRVEINQDGTGIDVLSDTSTGLPQALSIGEVAGGNTATLLGIRSFGPATQLSDFNDGRGVQVVHGSKDPITGLPAPSLDIDFAIVLGNGAGTAIDIDLRPQDVVSVNTLLARINAELATKLPAAGLAPTDLQVGLAADGNGLTFTQNSTFTGPIRVEGRNNSPAAEQLGLLGGNYDAPSATFTGADRAKVRPDTVFSHLIDLRDALRGNDTRGIQLAAEKLEGVIGALADTRGLVGSYAQRVDFAADRETDKATLDTKIRSELQDTDFTLAATRFTQLQTQLQAGYQVTAAASRLSLLDYLS